MRNYQDLVGIMKWVALATGIIGLCRLKQSLCLEFGSVGISSLEDFKFAEVLLGMGIVGFFGFGWMEKNIFVPHAIGNWQEWSECQRHIFENAREADVQAPQ